MKEFELRAIAQCGTCGQKLLAGGSIFFYTVEVRQFIIDDQAIRSQAGLGMMLSPALAHIMGPDADLAVCATPEPIRFSVCASCLAKEFSVGEMIERHGNKESEEER
jgi:hypothetical protein